MYLLRSIHVDNAICTLHRRVPVRIMWGWASTTKAAAAPGNISHFELTPLLRYGTGCGVPCEVPQHTTAYRSISQHTTASLHIPSHQPLDISHCCTSRGQAHTAILGLGTVLCYICPPTALSPPRLFSLSLAVAGRRCSCSCRMPMRTSPSWAIEG
jgi:hypothetical protein